MTNVGTTRLRCAADIVIRAQAAGALALTRLALRLLPFDRARALLQRSVRSRRTGDIDHARDLATAINAAARIIPGGDHCLSQALALMLLLGTDSEAALRIGVRRRGDTIAAHAWVELAGETLLGKIPMLDAFHPLEGLSLRHLGFRQSSGRQGGLR